MTLTAVGTNTIVGERSDSVTTLPITDSTTLTAGDFLELSSGKLIKSVTTLSTSLVGVAANTKTQLVASTSRQEVMGVIAEGLVIVKGLVEGSGGTYKTAISVGTKVSFHYDATAGYGQFVVNSTAAPIGTVVQGTVASSGSTVDYWDYVLVQLDFEGAAAGGSGIADGAVTTAKLYTGAVTGTKIATGGISSSTYLGTGVVSATKIAAGAVDTIAIADSAVTSTKTGTDVPGSINATKQHLDVGTFTLNATLGTGTVDWSTTLSSTAGVKVFLQALTVTGSIPVAGTMTDTSFAVEGGNAQTGVWFAWIPESSK